LYKYLIGEFEICAGLNQSSAIAPPTPCTRISTDLLPPSHPALDPVKLNIEADKLLEKMLASLGINFVSFEQTKLSDFLFHCQIFQTFVMCQIH
jgi:hypothetical protein